MKWWRRMAALWCLALGGAFASPAAEGELRDAAVEGSNAFGFDVYRRLAGITDNLFFSPYSLTESGALLLGGAEGETRAEILAVLRTPLTAREVHPAMSLLRQSLLPPVADAPPPYVLRTGSAVWVQDGLLLQPSYANLVRKLHGAAVTEVDFAGNPLLALQMINSWAERVSGGVIRRILSAEQLEAQTRLLLTNAVYFRCRWRTPFDPAKTVELPFTNPDGEVKVPTMTADGRFGHYEGRRFEMAEIPYRDEAFSLLVVVPKSDTTLADAEKRISSAALERWREKMWAQEMRIFLPRLKYSTSFSLKTVLPAMGMEDAFDRARADFSGICRAKRLVLDDILHRAYIEINEEGASAAAATTGALAPGLEEPTRPRIMRVDRPFFFVIRHNRTGAYLFMGRVQRLQGVASAPAEVEKPTPTPAPEPRLVYPEHPGYPPWRFGMNKREVRRQDKFGPYAEVERTDGLETVNGSFLGKRSRISFVFDDLGLNEIKVWVYGGEDREKAVAALGRVLDYMRGHLGEPSSRNIVITAGMDRETILHRVGEKLKTLPKTELGKVEIVPDRQPPGAYASSAIFYYPELGYYTFLIFYRDVGNLGD